VLKIAEHGDSAKLWVYYIWQTEHRICISGNYAKIWVTKLCKYSFI